MKKAFTLLEVIISISIFMIILLFLYKFIDNTKVVNKSFKEQISLKNNQNQIYEIFLEDFAEAQEIEVLNNKNKNQALKLISNNTYFNPFYNHITYFLSSNNELIRVESQKELKKENLNSNFFKNSYVHILLNDIKTFKILNKDGKYVVYLQTKKAKKVFYPVFKSL